MGKKETTGELAKFIRRAARKLDSSEEKTPMALEELRGQQSIAELCWREQTAQSLYYTLSKEIQEAVKKRLPEDTVREVASDEVKQLRHEVSNLSEDLAETL